MSHTVIPLVSACLGVTVGYWVGYRDGLRCRLCTKHKAKSQHHQNWKRHKAIQALRSING